MTKFIPFKAGTIGSEGIAEEGLDFIIVVVVVVLGSCDWWGEGLGVE